MKIIYRISDAGYSKVKPEYVNNELCLKNFCNVFFDYIYDILVIADNCSDNTITMIKKYIDPVNIRKVNVGHGAGTFNLALDMALGYDDETIIYFVENDYLHKQGSPRILVEGLQLGYGYVSLYDHPDKYINKQNGGNPFIEDGGEVTRVMLTDSCHWKLTNSTTMTFASTVGTLREDESILREFTKGSYPRDFEMFLALRENQKGLLTPIPGYSTHGETAWLTPLIDWSKI
jgi:glycosyltransferase involved in cell wall biosynthesis